MGYCMSQVDAKFHIKRENFTNARKAIQSLHGKERISDSIGKHFSWIDKDFYKINNFAKIMEEWRWEVHIHDDESGVDDIEFTGEKLGDDKILFDAIAPFVEAGSYIVMRGEEGEFWKWTFDGKTCKEVQAVGKVFEDDEDVGDVEKLRMQRVFNDFIKDINLTIAESDKNTWKTVNICFDGNVKKYLENAFKDFLTML